MGDFSSANATGGGLGLQGALIGLLGVALYAGRWWMNSWIAEARRTKERMEPMWLHDKELSIPDVQEESEARARSALLHSIDYTLLIHLVGASTFVPSSTASVPAASGLNGGRCVYAGEILVEFCLKPSAASLALAKGIFLNFSGGVIQGLWINGKHVGGDGAPLHAAGFLSFRLPEPIHWRRHRLHIPGAWLLARETNKVFVSFVNCFDQAGAGMQRVTDPRDNEEYLLADCRLYEAHRIFPCFDQADLQGTFSLTVTAPPSCSVVANTQVAHVYRDTVDYTLKTRKEENLDVDESLPPSFLDDVPRGACRVWAFKRSGAMSPSRFFLAVGPFQVFRAFLPTFSFFPSAASAELRRRRSRLGLRRQAGGADTHSPSAAESLQYTDLWHSSPGESLTTEESDEASSEEGEHGDRLVPLAFYLRASRRFASEDWEMLLSLLTDAFTHFEQFFQIPFGGHKLDVLFLPHDLSPLSYATNGALLLRDSLLECLFLPPAPSRLLEAAEADDILSAVHTLYRVVCGLWTGTNPCACALDASTSLCLCLPRRHGSEALRRGARREDETGGEAESHADEATSRGDPHTWWSDAWIPDAIAIYLAAEALGYSHRDAFLRLLLEHVASRRFLSAWLRPLPFASPMEAASASLSRPPSSVFFASDGAFSMRRLCISSPFQAAPLLAGPLGPALAAGGALLSPSRPDALLRSVSSKAPLGAEEGEEAALRRSREDRLWARSPPPSFFAVLKAAAALAVTSAASVSPRRRVGRGDGCGAGGQRAPDEDQLEAACGVARAKGDSQSRVLKSISTTAVLQLQREGTKHMQDRLAGAALWRQRDRPKRGGGQQGPRAGGAESPSEGRIAPPPVSLPDSDGSGRYSQEVEPKGARGDRSQAAGDNDSEGGEAADAERASHEEDREDARLLEDALIWHWFHAHIKQWAYTADSKPTTHPLCFALESTDASSLVIPAIAFGKGAALLRQCRCSVGSEHFAESLRRYVRLQHRFAPSALVLLRRCLYLSPSPDASGGRSAMPGASSVSPSSSSSSSAPRSGLSWQPRASGAGARDPGTGRTRGSSAGAGFMEGAGAARTRGGTPAELAAGGCERGCEGGDKGGRGARHEGRLRDDAAETHAGLSSCATHSARLGEEERMARRLHRRQQRNANIVSRAASQPARKQLSWYSLKTLCPSESEEEDTASDSDRSSLSSRSAALGEGDSEQGTPALQTGKEGAERDSDSGAREEKKEKTLPPRAVLLGKWWAQSGVKVLRPVWICSRTLSSSRLAPGRGAPLNPSPPGPRPLRLSRGDSLASSASSAALSSLGSRGDARGGPLTRAEFVALGPSSVSSLSISSFHLLQFDAAFPRLPGSSAALAARGADPSNAPALPVQRVALDCFFSSQDPHFVASRRKEKAEEPDVEVQRIWVSVTEKMTAIRELLHTPSPRAVLCNPTDELYLLPYLDDASQAFLLPSLPSLSASSMHRLLIAAALWTRVKEARLPADVFLQHVLHAMEHEREVALLACVFNFLYAALLNFIPEPLFFSVAASVSHTALLRAAGGARVIAPLSRSSSSSLESPVASPSPSSFESLSSAAFVSAASLSGASADEGLPFCVRAFWMDVAVRTAFTPCAVLRLLHLLHLQDFLLQRVSLPSSPAKAARLKAPAPSSSEGNKRSRGASCVSCAQEPAALCLTENPSRQAETGDEQRMHAGFDMELSRPPDMAWAGLHAGSRRRNSEAEDGLASSLSHLSGGRTAGAEHKACEGEVLTAELPTLVIGAISASHGAKRDGLSRPQQLCPVSAEDDSFPWASPSRRAARVSSHSLSRQPPFPLLPCCGVLRSHTCDACLAWAAEKRNTLFQQMPSASLPPQRRCSVGSCETLHSGTECVADAKARRHSAGESGERVSRHELLRRPGEGETVPRGISQAATRGRSQILHQRPGARHITNIGEGQRDNVHCSEGAETSANVSSSIRDRKEVPRSPEGGSSRSVSLSLPPPFPSSAKRKSDISVAICTADFSRELATPNAAQPPHSCGHWCSGCGVFCPLMESPASPGKSSPGVHTPPILTRATSAPSGTSLESPMEDLEALEHEVSRRASSGGGVLECIEEDAPAQEGDRPQLNAHRRNPHAPAQQISEARKSLRQREGDGFPHEPVRGEGVTSSREPRAGERVLFPGVHTPVLDATVGSRLWSGVEGSRSRCSSDSIQVQHSKLLVGMQFVRIVRESEGTACPRVLQVPHIPQGAAQFPPFLTQMQRWLILERLFACRDTDLAAVAPPLNLGSQPVLPHHANGLPVPYATREESAHENAPFPTPRSGWTLESLPGSAWNGAQELVDRSDEAKRARIAAGARIWSDAKRHLLRRELAHDPDVIRRAAGAARCHAAAPSDACKDAHFCHFINPPAQSSSVAAAAAAALAAFQQRAPGHRELLAEFEERFFECIFDVYLQLPRPVAHAVWTHLFPFHHPTQRTVQRTHHLLLKVRQELRKRTQSHGAEAGSSAAAQRADNRTAEKNQRAAAATAVAAAADATAAAGASSNRQGTGGREWEGGAFSSASRHRDQNSATGSRSALYSRNGSLRGKNNHAPDRRSCGESERRRGAAGAGGALAGGAKTEAEKNALVCLLRAAADAQARLLLSRRCRDAVLSGTQQSE
ncbi:hypothetical protein BESB_001660 [Besnoitia besnoiti]|uniref:Uncharacterized protein n=1 Tax=Besnoitia besnoiti TaxID=94643 RepID=A0A2A9MKR2_BESBE|nr:hypothetical protein BESB_001660 [Besnoitia besnoiti]PFH37824.1 hypothetical protein BESB_001660 [Besnoitia besnoiti]